ncbi:hypothetical protein [Phyllobacterium leguminum]|uniref:Lipoprotein n=1 Tax=Phyllobacterium leguminum TaxID=314237 RepID=A0A318T5Z5_9HYPH|nr:hypothetical protein [Phyllobacterium leguminum]PYE89725.1 hypothetical protein C7477_103234 [Phyllobacterium leguminum]
MRAYVRTGTHILLLTMLAPLAACSTVSQKPVPVTVGPAAKATAAKTVAAKPAAPAKTFNPLPSILPTFSRGDVDPALARACVTAAADKYFMPESAISALDTRSAGGGNTAVVLKVDLRDALCTVNANGSVRSVIDTSPKSADQIAAEEAAAAKRNAPPAVKPVAKKKKKKSS